ncbi:MAG TPA: D-alanine--D-alanine ligase family protein [Herpetosiphonaceae bacterium]
MADKIRVGVIFGGRSGEHEVSLKSARSVMDALDPEKYDVVPIGITREGRWVSGGDPLLALETAADQKLLGRAPQPGPASTTALVTAAGQLPGAASLGAIDVILPVLHGPFGEDGTIQGMFELADLPYVGCGVLAASVSMDKALMKAAFAAAGLAQVPWQLVLRHELRAGSPLGAEAVAARLEAALPYPMFVKPANLGSSVGISKARDRAELLAGLAEAAGYDRRIVVEQGIEADEIEVAVLGNDDPQASVPGDVLPANDFYDYADKYLEGRTRFRIPADLDPATSERLRAMAVTAFKAVDGAGLARVDFFRERGSGDLYINEINTFPGFTAASQYPKLWEASGLPYRELLDRLIELALERHREKRA